MSNAPLDPLKFMSKVALNVFPINKFSLLKTEGHKQVI